MDIYEFWNVVLAQNEKEIRKYFQNDACIKWHCTNERFNLDEFIIANCDYPGDWYKFTKSGITKEKAILAVCEMRRMA